MPLRVLIYNSSVHAAAGVRAAGGYRNRRLARDNWLMDEHPISFISRSISVAHEAEGLLNARLAGRRQREQIVAADTHRFGAQRKRL